MDTMREKIARALALDEYDGGHLSGAEIEACVEDDMRTSRRAHLLRKADAVLDAMREPTEDMVVAGIIERHGSETPEAWKLATANIFTAMIDAAKDGA